MIWPKKANGGGVFLTPRRMKVFTLRGKDIQKAGLRLWSVVPTSTRKRSFFARAVISPLKAASQTSGASQSDTTSEYRFYGSYLNR